MTFTSLRKKLKFGIQETAHVGYVKLVYLMFVLFNLLGLHSFLKHIQKQPTKSVLTKGLFPFHLHTRRSFLIYYFIYFKCQGALALDLKFNKPPSCVPLFCCSNLNILLVDFKVGLSPSKKCFYIFFNDSPSKILRSSFYFILRAPFVLKIFKFLS